MASDGACRDRAKWLTSLAEPHSPLISLPRIRLSRASLWSLVPLAACAWVLGNTSVRVAHLETISALPTWSVDVPAAEPGSPTGFTDGTRWMLVPERYPPSYRWIADAQTMLAGGPWRVRQVEEENAPHGRSLHASSLYRWWLGAVATVSRAFTGESPGRAVERAALWADPILHVLFIVALTVFLRWQFGRMVAIAGTIAAAGLFPLAASFVPGMPQQLGLTRIVALASILALVPGILSVHGATADSSAKARSWFIAAGILGGVGLWLDVAVQATVIVGLAAGGIFAAWIARRGVVSGAERAREARRPAEPAVAAEVARRSVADHTSTRPGTAAAAPGQPSTGLQGAKPTLPMLPWRAWGLATGVSSLVAYLIEFAPAHVGLRLETNHPLYAIAVVGLAELVHRACTWIVAGSAPSRLKEAAFSGSRGKHEANPSGDSDSTVQRHRSGAARRRVRDMVAISAAALAVLAAPITAAVFDAGWFWGNDPWAARLSGLVPVEADSTWEWIVRDGIGGTALATMLPAVAAAVLAALLLRSRTPGHGHLALAVATGPVMAAGLAAGPQLSGWSLLDVTIIALLVAGMLACGLERTTQRHPLLGFGVLIFVLIPGMAQVLPRRAERDVAATEQDVFALVERDLACWLRHRSENPNTTVLASPQVTSSLIHFGGLRGIATLDWENGDGVRAAIRIANAGLAEEARALIEARGITHLVLTSWDRTLDQLALADPAAPESSDGARDPFWRRLRRWAPPPWLRPLPYHVARIPGFDGAEVVVFEVVPNEDPVLAACWMAEYFAEMRQPESATAVAEELRRHPGHPGAVAALAWLAVARGDAGAVSAAGKRLLALVQTGEAEYLPWDRRVSLACILAQARLTDAAHAQVEHCLATIDASLVRSLTPGALANFLALLKTLGLTMPDEDLAALAQSLLPPAARQRVQ